MHTVRARGAIALLCLLVFGCTAKLSLEARVRELIAGAVQAAEAGDATRLRSLISADYRDDAGRDRRALDGLLRVYLLQHRPLYLYTHLARVSFADPDRAHVSIYAAMAGRRIVDAAELAEARAGLYRFDLTLGLEHGEWRLRTATWRAADLSDIYASSTPGVTQ